MMGDGIVIDLRLVQGCFAIKCEVQLPHGCRLLSAGEEMAPGDLWLNFAWLRWEPVSDDFVGMCADNYMVIRRREDVKYGLGGLSPDQLADVRQIKACSYFDEDGLQMTHVTCDVCGRQYREIFDVALSIVMCGAQNRCINHDGEASEPAVTRLTLKGKNFVVAAWE
jgi:hypothetical protein